MFALSRRVWFAGVMAILPFALTAQAAPISLNTWGEFSFTTVGILATGCDPADPTGGFCIGSSGTPTDPLPAPPWTFTAPAGGVQLTVTDAFEAGDRFQVLDFGVAIGTTSAPSGSGDCGDDPVPCLADPNISKGTFSLTSGNHSITIIPTASEGGGVGYLLASATAVPEPSTWLLLGSSLFLLNRYRGRGRLQ